MNSGARSFLGSLVDYAGLFPPAALDVAPAVAEYARHRGEPEAWMLGRFIAPAGRLPDIAVAAEPFLAAGTVWPFSILVGDREDQGKARAAVVAQAKAIHRFTERLSHRVLVASLEAPIPLGSADAMADFVPEFLTALAAEGLAGREIFLELPAGGDDEHLLAAMASAAEDLADREDGFSLIGAKLRCGGVTAEAFPDCERVARVIHRAAALALPIKCTAGLHHPVRHRATRPDVMMHGFLNVFGAGLLARVLQLDLPALIECVAETDPKAFTLNAAGFGWREHRVAADDIQRARDNFLCGFGSCSFAEPRADLQAMAILPAD